mmetsp:Transcript_20653/g.49056  ORF Transcript_20653/g.49056 Transcript_20653/m.49056 type:complete len:285 (+) Transcript_20653:3020-3874(+)
MLSLSTNCWTTCRILSPLLPLRSSSQKRNSALWVGIFHATLASTIRSPLPPPSLRAPARNRYLTQLPLPSPQKKFSLRPPRKLKKRQLLRLPKRLSRQQHSPPTRRPRKRRTQRCQQLRPLVKRKARCPLAGTDVLSAKPFPATTPMLETRPVRSARRATSGGPATWPEARRSCVTVRIRELRGPPLQLRRKRQPPSLRRARVRSRRLRPRQRKPSRPPRSPRPRKSLSLSPPPPRSRNPQPQKSLKSQQPLRSLNPPPQKSPTRKSQPPPRNQSRKRAAASLT